MAKQSKTILKTYFNTGDRPTESDFVDLIDSQINITDDKATQLDIDAGTNDDKFVTPLGITRAITTSVKEATISTKGIAEIATLAEVETGTDNTRYVTPEGAKRAVEKHALIKKVNTITPDSSGNIQIDNITGNAGTATKLALPKKINGVDFDGTADITLPTAASAIQVFNAFLTATQSNATITPTELTSHTFTLPAGKSAVITGNLIFTAAATTTGAAYGIKVSQPSAANGNVIGSWSIEVSVSSNPVTTGIRDGDLFNIAPNTESIAEVVGTASLAGNNSATMNVVLKNNATNNTSATIKITFRSEVAASAITAQVGTGAFIVIS